MHRSKTRHQMDAVAIGDKLTSEYEYNYQMTVYLRFAILSFGLVFFAAPVNAAGVDYVKCDAMQNAVVRLANTPEMQIVSQLARNRAIRNSTSSAGEDRLYLEYYPEAIGQLKRGIGDPEQVAVLKKISGILAEKEKMGCP